jgi:glycosyltransferase involved in cell wall biosynthesis
MSLSIIIPSRNEMFLNKTIEDILTNIEGDTEIIAVLDGAWPIEPIEQNEKVKVIYLPDSVGQRAAINIGVKISTKDYVMKVDAHCAFDKGFDVKLMQDCTDDMTIVPMMYNLHAFDWVCEHGRKYQGPTPECGDAKREMIWKAKPSPETTAMRFDTELKFQYWGEYKAKQQGDLVETMSILGACFMMKRKRYWELGGSDEAHGSWGQQGTEIACKTWLSGGRLIVSKKTWFAHMFRTQGGDFSFPYPISHSQQEKAREYSRNLWLSDKWPMAKYPLSWLIEKFNPPEWGNKNKAIAYFTDNQLKLSVAHMCQKNLLKANLDITSVSLKPMALGNNFVIKEPRSYITMFKQILKAIQESRADIIFLCEHDVLYHRSHFDFTPPTADKFYYNVNVWKVREDGHCLKVDDCRQVSGLCAYRSLLLEHYTKRLELIATNGFSRSMGFEPGTHNRAERVDNYKSDIWSSKYPNLDIRHGGNLTADRWSKDQFRNPKYTKGWTEKNIIDIEGWNSYRQI